MDLYLKSYEVIFIMLFSITILTGLRSLQDKLTKNQRISLHLSTLVTIIASMHYFLMIQNNDKVEVYRYFDWFFTTPILLVDLCILLDIEDPYFMFEIVIYNTLMLLFGFLSEINYISMLNGTILGFIPFILIFKRIKDRLGENTKDEQYKLLYTFFSLWSLYGVNHMIKDSTIKNLNYNALDFATKGMFGLYIYAKSW